MTGPVGLCHRGVGYGVAAVDKAVVSHIDPHVGYRHPCVIGASEKDQVAGFGIGRGDRRGGIVEPLGGGASYVPLVSAVVDDPADIPRAVKRGGGVGAAPDIRET